MLIHDLASHPLSYISTMPFDINDDEHVAKLLAQDAKKTSKTYDLVGLDAFNPKRCVGSLLMSAAS